MKRNLFLLLLLLIVAVGNAQNYYEEDLMDISNMPAGAERVDSYFQHAVYIYHEGESGEELNPYITSVWLADERCGTVRKICVTNPKGDAQWHRMAGSNDAVEVPLDMIVIAEEAYLFPGDVSKVVVEGCPDGRNIWTYIIDPDTHTAKQFPTTEGVFEKNWEDKEIILSSYGYYEEGGRYTYKRAYNSEGKFLRFVGDKEPE